MATDFTQESVMRFILTNGGKVRNADLLTHFRRFLREDEDREQNRELFKRYVNSVATVRQEEGVSHVVLRKKYRVHLGDIAKNRDEKLQQERQKDRDPKPVVSKTQERGATKLNIKPQAPLPIPALQSKPEILPAAGIVSKINNNINNNNDSAPSLETLVKSSLQHEREQSVVSSSCVKQVNDTCPLKPAPSDTDSRSSGSGQSFEQTWESKGTGEATVLKNNSVYPAKQRQLKEADGCEQSFVTPSHCSYYEVSVTPPTERRSLNTNTEDLRSFIDLKQHSEEPVTKQWPLYASLGQSHIYSSTPCLLDQPVAPRTQPYLQTALSRSNESLLKPNGGYNGVQIQESEDHAAETAFFKAQRYNLPQDAPPHTYLQLRHPSSLSSSRDSVTVPSPSTPPSDTGWPQGFGRDEWSSDEGLKYKGLRGQDGSDVQAFLRRSQEAKLLSHLHQPTRKAAPLHCSTGDLDDEDTRASPRSSSPEARYGPVARRLSSRLRSRLCRSLGEDLNQPFPEDTISARHNRLQLLSTTLSMGNLVSNSSSRGHSSRDLSSAGGSTPSLGTSGHDGSFSSKQSSVPLDPREHDWFVKAASGIWTDIYALFRDDPNLLTKRDFISGFTVLHWIAKHGDHRVLNTLWYGVEKAGMTLDVNAKSMSGYTPLHLAAIHGHKKLIRLLVQKFKADVRIRDSSGKRPWQYLNKNENWDILELLGAPQKIISASPAMQSSTEKQTTRPATTRVNVKRHTSIAALFKHKSHLRVSSSPEAFL